MEQFAALVANMPTNEDAFLLFNILVNNFLRLVPIIDWEKSSPFPGKFHSDTIHFGIGTIIKQVCKLKWLIMNLQQYDSDEFGTSCQIVWIM